MQQPRDGAGGRLLRDKQQELWGGGRGSGEARAEDGEPGIHRGPQSPQ